MKNSEQRSLRLSRYHLKIIDNVQLDKGLNFTDAVKYIISAYEDGVHAENSLNQIFRKLDSKISNISVSGEKDPTFLEDAIIEEIHDLGKTLDLVVNAIYIIGSANSRTLGAINDLFKEDAEK